MENKSEEQILDVQRNYVTSLSEKAKLVFYNDAFRVVTGQKGVFTDARVCYSTLLKMNFPSTSCTESPP